MLELAAVKHVGHEVKIQSQAFEPVFRYAHIYMKDRDRLKQLLNAANAPHTYTLGYCLPYVWCQSLRCCLLGAHVEFGQSPHQGQVVIQPHTVNLEL